MQILRHEQLEIPPNILLNEQQVLELLTPHLGKMVTITIYNNTTSILIVGHHINWAMLSFKSRLSEAKKTDPTTITACIGGNHAPSDVMAFLDICAMLGIPFMFMRAAILATHIPTPLLAFGWTDACLVYSSGVIQTVLCMEDVHATVALTICAHANQAAMNKASGRQFLEGAMLPPSSVLESPLGRLSVGVLPKVLLSTATKCAPTKDSLPKLPRRALYSSQFVNSPRVGTRVDGRYQN
jgi:hypothetical protein